MKQVPILDLKLEYQYMKKEIDEAIAQCLEHQQWIMGPEVHALEEHMAEYLSAPSCIGVSSGTEALVLALRALSIKLSGREYFQKEQKIITTPFTFSATGDAIVRSGATPLFVDIHPETFTIHPKKIEECLKQAQGADIIGILPVHLYGQACEMDHIKRLAEEYHLFIVEDAAQAFGGEYQGKKLGSIGDIGAFSFFPSKNLGAFGDAGMAATHDAGLAEILEILRKHGGKNKNAVEHVGYNARLDTVQAAVLLVKLKYIDEFNDRRRTIARLYNEHLGDIEGVTIPSFTDSEKDHIFHQYTIRLPKDRRDRVQEKLTQQNIGSMIYYAVPLHQMKLFQSYGRVFENLAASEKASQEVLSLPIEPLLEEKDIIRICNTIKKALSG